jgi:DNA-binding response OmpR family regulator
MNRTTRVGSLVLDHDARTASRGTSPLEIGGGAEWRTLELLVENAGRIVGYDRFEAELGCKTSKATVQKLVYRVRRAVGRDAGVEIVNHSGAGYRLAVLSRHEETAKSLRTSANASVATMES